MHSLPSRAIAPALVLAIALATASCATPATHATVPAGAAGMTAIEGTVASIDTRPWTYDGHALVEIDVPGRGLVTVQLPARWSLCQAAPVDVEALAEGMRVQAVGAAGDDGRVTVCSDPAHRLVPMADRNP